MALCCVWQPPRTHGFGTSPLCSAGGCQSKGRKFSSPTSGLEISLFLGSIKQSSSGFSVFGIWGKACGRGRSFLLLHPKPGGCHSGQALGKLALGPTARPGPQPIALSAPGLRCCHPAKRAMWLIEKRWRALNPGCLPRGSPIALGEWDLHRILRIRSISDYLF